MSTKKICDFCEAKIEEVDVGCHKVNVDGNELDICETCFTGQVILSEQRRVRVMRKRRARKLKEAAQ